MRERYLPLLATIAVFLVLFATGGLLYKNFLSTLVLGDMLADNAFITIAAIGTTFVILSGGIDLSIGSMIGPTALLASQTARRRSSLRDLAELQQKLTSPRTRYRRRAQVTEAVEAINDLYRHELRCWLNLFRPSVKLLKKKRVGSKLRRVYGPAQTPLERVAQGEESDPE